MRPATTAERCGDQRPSLPKFGECRNSRALEEAGERAMRTPSSGYGRISMRANSLFDQPPDLLGQRTAFPRREILDATAQARG